MAHAYLFEGQRGTGKRETALYFAKLFFCEEPTSKQEPCEECSTCKRIRTGNLPDLHMVIPTGNSIKKEQIQNLQREFSMSGVESDKKVYIIEHADKMTDSAANSLLKFLEEPTGDSLAILLTEQPQNILQTIKSRCQPLSFLPLPQERFVQQLISEGISESIAKVLSALTHNIEEAKSWEEEDWFIEAVQLTRKMASLWFQKPMNAFIAIQEGWVQHFSDKDKQLLALELLSVWVKDVLYLQVGKEDSIHFTQNREDLYEQARKTNPSVLAESLSALTEARKRMASNVSFQLCLEKAVIHSIQAIHKK